MKTRLGLALFKRTTLAKLSMKFDNHTSWTVSNV